MSLEQRVMFDGAAVTQAAAHALPDPAAHAALPEVPAPVEVRAADPSLNGGRKEVVFVDTAVAGYQALESGARAGVEVVEIDGNFSGLAQIAKWAESHQGYDAVHILSRGAEAALYLGSDTVNQSSLASGTVGAELAALGHSLKAGGDLMLYGCSTASGADGERFIDDLARATGADVAASTGLTGTADAGGNWYLEAHVGAIGTASVETPQAMASYGHVLGIADSNFDSGSLVTNDGVASATYDGWQFGVTSGTTDFANANNVDLTTFMNQSSGRTIIANYQGNSVTSFYMKSADGTNFQLDSFDISNVFNGASTSLTIAGYRDGSLVVTGESVNLNSTDSSGNISYTFQANDGTGIVWGNLSFNAAFNNVDEVRFVFGADAALGIDNVNVSPAVAGPTVTDPRISITSSGSGTGGAYKIGDTVTATWNNTAGGDNNSGVTGVTMNFSQFGGGAAVAATNSSGTWTASYTITAGVTDLSNRNVSVSATDANGTTTVADTTNLTVDNVAPTVTDARISISGASGTGGAYKIGDTITATWNNTAGGDNNTDTISGVTVDFSAFGGGAAVAATNSSGTWTATYTITAGAVDATSRNVSVTATDNAGNTTTRADTTNATVDSVAPTVNDARISISGASGTGGAYKIGDTVTATWNNTAGGDNNTDTISSVTVNFSQFGGGSAVSASNSAGTWTATYTLVAGAINGTANRNVSVTATDNAGNATTSADTTNATVDNVVPAITFSGIALSADSGSSSSDFITNTASQTITATLSGALNGGDIVYGSLDNGGTWTDITNKVSGTALAWNGVTFSGSSTLRLKVTDAAGNDGTVASQAYVLDTTTPSAPSTPDMTSGTDSGSSSSDNITGNTTPTFTGTAEAGSTVTLYDTDGTTVLGTATATGGNWSITSSSLSAGSHTLTAKATDTAGNTSSSSSGLSVVVDTAAPTGLGLDQTTVPTASATSTATIATLSATDAQSITYSLAAGNGTNDADNGSFSIVGTSLKVGGSSLSAGTYHVYVAATDVAGNVANQAFTITVVDAPTVSSIVRTGGASATVAASASSISYTVSFNESVTGVDASDFSLTATGTASGNIASVSGTGTTYTVTVNTLSGDGTVRLDLNNSGTGIQNGNSVAIAGGYTSGSTYTMDHTAPSATSTPDMTSGTDSGASSTDNITSDTTPTFTGTAESGSTVTLYDTDGTTVLGTATATGGNWSITSSALSDGSHTLTAKATDAAGNVSSASSGLAATIDATAPVVNSVSVPANGAYAAGQNLDFTVNLSEAVTVDTGGGTPYVTLTIGATPVQASYLSGSGTNALAFRYTVLPSQADANGITVGALSSNGATLRDTAGNNTTLTLNSVGSTASVLVDTTAPTTTVSSAAFSNDTGSSSTDFITSATAQTLSGTLSSNLAADETVQVSLDNGATWTAAAATVGQNTWSLAGQTLAGSSTLKVKVADAAGNDGSVFSQAYVLDTTAPTTTVATAALSSDTGSSNTDFITSTAAQTVSGTLSANLAAGETVQVSLDNGATWTAATATVGQSTWSLAGQTLAGSNTLKVKVTDTAGNDGSVFSQAYVLDTTAPTTNVATAAFSNDTGTSNTDFITSTAAQTLSGTLSANLAAGETVQVSLDNGATWSTATATVGQSTWSLAGQTLASSNTLKVKLTDAAGNDGTALLQAYVLDTTAPATAVATAAFSNDTGTSSTDFITTAASQTVSGTLSANLAAGETVQVSLDNGATWSTATATVGQSTWSLAGQTLAGSNTLKVKVTDAAGNDGSVLSQAYVLDTTGPAISFSNLALSNDTGSSSTDFITSTAGQTLSATLSSAPAGADRVFGSLNGGATWTDITNKVSGATLSWNGITLAGSNVLMLKVTDAAGNDSTPTSQAYVLDTTAPTTTVTGVAFSNDTGTSHTDFITSAAAQTVSGTLSANLAAGETVQVSLDNGATWSTATATVGQSTWSLASQTLTGSNTLKVKLTDAAGNDGAALSQAYVLNTTAPATTVTGIALSNDTGTSTTDFITSTAAQTISGSLSTNLAAGETVQVSLDNGATWTAAAATAGQNTWSLASQTLTGSNTLKVKVTDAAGNDGSVLSQAYVLDTTGPNISFSNLALSNDTGSSSTDFITSTAGQTLSATLSSAPAGADRVFSSLDGGATWTDITSKVSGSTLSWNGITLAGSNVLMLKVTDAAGNDSTPTSQAYVLDTTAPATTVTTAAFSNDTGTSNTDFITSAAAQTLSGTLSANLAAGEMVQVSLDNGATWSTATATVGQSTWSLASQTLAGSNTLQAKVTDAAGNDSIALSQAYVLNTAAPSTTVTGIALSNDTGTSSTDFITSTAAQTLSGTLSANLAPGETVQVSLDNGATWTAATATAGQNTWSLASQTLAGSNTLKVKVTDAAGNDGSVLSQAYVLDTTAPQNVAIVDANSADTTPTLTGTAALGAGETLAVSIGGASYAVVPVQGQWNLDLATAVPVSGALALERGHTYTVTVAATDTAGNVASFSGALTIAPEPPPPVPEPAPAPPPAPAAAAPAAPPPPPEPPAPTVAFLSPAARTSLGGALADVGTRPVAAALPVGPSPNGTPSPAAPPLDSRSSPTLAPQPTLTQGGSSNFRVVVAPMASGGSGESLVLNRGIPDQQVSATGRTEITVPPDAFAHTNPQATVQLSARQADGRPLPNWMSFDARTGKLSVQPPPGVSGELTVRVVARDAQGHEAVTVFKVQVGNKGPGRQSMWTPSGRSGLSEQLRLAATARMPLDKDSAKATQLPAAEAATTGGA